MDENWIREELEMVREVLNELAFRIDKLQEIVVDENRRRIEQAEADIKELQDYASGAQF